MTLVNGTWTFDPFNGGIITPFQTVQFHHTGVYFPESTIGTINVDTTAVETKLNEIDITLQKQCVVGSHIGNNLAKHARSLNSTIFEAFGTTREVENP